jgi:hypothetical protein
MRPQSKLIKAKIPPVKYSKNLEWRQNEKKQKSTVGWNDSTLEAASMQALEELVYCMKGQVKWHCRMNRHCQVTHGENLLDNSPCKIYVHYGGAEDIMHMLSGRL